MAIPIPKLDDLTWEELVAEGRSLIPGYAPHWTNHNSADPGITLMELFAYLSEMLLFRLDQVSVNSIVAMLKLINGQDWKRSADLHADKRQTILQLRRPARAVTEADYELLTLAVNDGLEPSAKERVARAKCIPGRDLTNERPAALDEDAPAHVSVVVLPAVSEMPSNQLLRLVYEQLEPARLLTTKVHVVAPRYAAIGIRVRLVVSSGFDLARTREAVERFFHPLHGGAGGKGWPFGRNVYVSELYELLNRQPGVAYAARRRDRASNEPEPELRTMDAGEAWRLARNSAGELEAIELKADELVKAEIHEEDFDVTIQGRRSCDDE
jgi:hypothetical protein